MSKYFNLDLENKTDAAVRAEAGKFIVKINVSTYFSTLSTVALKNAIDKLKDADDNKGGGVTTTTIANTERVAFDYQFNAIVGLIDTMIADPDILDAKKQLMMEDTGLTLKKIGVHEKHKFGFHQTDGQSPAYLGARGIEGGGGLHQWKITKDVLAFTGFVLLDPTETAEIELTTVSPKTEYAAMHRTRKHGIFSAWEGPMTFMTK